MRAFRGRRASSENQGPQHRLDAVDSRREVRMDFLSYQATIVKRCHAMFRLARRAVGHVTVANQLGVRMVRILPAKSLSDVGADGIERIIELATQPPLQVRRQA